MTIRTLFATATICSLVTLTGCATKEIAKIDVSQTSTALTAPVSAPSPRITIKTDGGAVTDSVIVAENSPKAGGEAGQDAGTGTKSRLDTVYFDFDAFLLTAEARDTLSRNARWLAENKITRLIIEGHADERGADDYNLALSEKRAFAVRSYIESLGATPDLLETISYGEDKPAVVGHDDAS